MIRQAPRSSAAPTTAASTTTDAGTAGKNYPTHNLVSVELDAEGQPLLNEEGKVAYNRITGLYKNKAKNGAEYFKGVDKKNGIAYMIFVNDGKAPKKRA